MKYRLYAGLGGGFGGAEYFGTEDFNSESDALDAARDEAVQSYESYEGLHGIRSIDDIMEEDGIDDYDDANETYQDEMESWLDYYVKVATDENEE